MFEKCPTCQSRIVVGGLRFVKWTFCNEKCRSQFKVALGERLVSSEELARRIHEVFEAECPSCHRFGHNSLVSTSAITGLLVVFHVKRQKHICCARCARWKVLIAAAHSLAFGWWSPKALFVTPFIMSANLLTLLFIREPKAPSVTLVKFIKTQIAEELAPRLHADALARRRAIKEIKDEAESRDEEAEWV